MQKGGDEARKEEDLAECLRRAPCPRLRRSEVASLPPTPYETPLFLCRLYSGEASIPANPSPPTRREREPPPLYGSAGGGGGVVSWPPWRAALSTYSHPRLTSSPSPLRFLFSLFPTWPHAPTIFLPPLFSRTLSFSLLDVLAASVYPDFSPTHSPHRPP